MFIVVVGLLASPAMVHAAETTSPSPASERLAPVKLYDDTGWNQGKPDAATPCDGGACADSGIGRQRGAGRLPEPASWALMLIGAGGVGALARRRRAADREVPTGTGRIS